jgi:hypothetical protein
VIWARFFPTRHRHPSPDQSAPLITCRILQVQPAARKSPVSCSKGVGKGSKFRPSPQRAGQHGKAHTHRSARPLAKGDGGETSPAGAGAGPGGTRAARPRGGGMLFLTLHSSDPGRLGGNIDTIWQAGPTQRPAVIRGGPTFGRARAPPARRAQAARGDCGRRRGRGLRARAGRGRRKAGARIAQSRRRGACCSRPIHPLSCFGGFNGTPGR